MEDTNVIIDAPPLSSDRIDELWAWIALEPDGGQGIVACPLPGIGTAPMISGKRAIAEGMRPLVESVVKLLYEKTGRDIKVELVRFARSEAIAVIQLRPV